MGAARLEAAWFGTAGKFGGRVELGSTSTPIVVTGRTPGSIIGFAFTAGSTPTLITVGSGRAFAAVSAIGALTARAIWPVTTITAGTIRTIATALGRQLLCDGLERLLGLDQLQQSRSPIVFGAIGQHRDDRDAVDLEVCFDA
jgi:hypothetical protein